MIMVIADMFSDPQKESDILSVEKAIKAHPPSAYKSRKNGIEESNEPIERVFFIIDDRLVPDYYSECLFYEVDFNPFSVINKQNSYRRFMYHGIF